MNTQRKNFLITGVSAGLGRQLATAALAAGHKVVGTVRKAADAAEFEALAPGLAFTVLMDIADSQSVKSGVEAALGHLDGRIDVLANNAGAGFVAAIEETSDEEAHSIFELNFFGQLSVTRAVLPVMRAQKSGYILNYSAIGGFAGFPGLGVYSAAKAATDVYSEALAAEVAPLGIKVTVLTVGIFRTGFASGSLKMGELVIEDYSEGPAGKFKAFISGLDGKQPNDPAKGAAAIMRLVDSENPPLHFALGADAVGVINKKIANVQRDLDAWKHIGANVGF